MSKEELERYLAEGLSLEQIGNRVGRSPSTISYHLKKHGLKPVNQGKHANKGRISEQELQILVNGGATLREMAAELDRSVATIRHWLKKYGLVVDGSRRRALAKQARKAGLKYAALECEHHGLTKFVLEGRGYFRCMQCRKERVSEWRRRVKRRLVEEAGGACLICGYHKCLAALEFHHRDRKTKLFALSRQGVTRSFEEARAEARKCDLLCANCHAEVENGVTEIPPSARLRLVS
jgi:DNA-binding CsgD family transcriptional regulator